MPVAHPVKPEGKLWSKPIIPKSEGVTRSAVAWRAQAEEGRPGSLLAGRCPCAVVGRLRSRPCAGGGAGAALPGYRLSAHCIAYSPQ